MIHVTNIRTVDTALYDETWAIVRSLKNPSARYKQVPELSPSMELFSLYREMVKQLQWGLTRSRIYTFLASSKRYKIAKKRMML